MKKPLLALAAAVLALAQLPALAQSWPARTVKIIVPFPAGGPTDVLTRYLAEKLSAQLGQPVVVENKPGAGGSIGADLVAKSAPDGYTLVMATASTHSIGPYLGKLPYDPVKDFTAITLTSTVPLVLVAHPAFAANNVQEFIAQAKAKPGAINYTSTGSGSAQHLAMEFLIDAAGLKLTHVPHKAMGAALTDLMAGTIPVMFTGISNVVNLAKEGKVKVLAISTTKRSPVMPQVPTLAEAGVPGYGYAAWNGIVAAAATPPEVVRRLHAEFAKALAHPNVRAKLGGLGFDLVGSGPQEFSELIRGDVTRLARLVRSAGIQVN